MYNFKQEENFDVFLARKFYEEKTREDINAGLRLVYRVIKAYENKATKEIINRYVNRIVPSWMLKQGVVSLDGCLTYLIKKNYIALDKGVYSISADKKEIA